MSHNDTKLEIGILRDYNEAATRNGLTTDFTVMVE